MYYISAGTLFLERTISIENKRFVYSSISQITSGMAIAINIQVNIYSVTH